MNLDLWDSNLATFYPENHNMFSVFFHIKNQVKLVAKN